MKLNPNLLRSFGFSLIMLAMAVGPTSVTIKTAQAQAQTSVQAIDKPASEPGTPKLTHPSGDQASTQLVAPEGSSKVQAKSQVPTQVKLSDIKRDREVVSLSERLRSLLGLVFLLLCCWFLSNRRDLIPWRIIAWGVSLQLILGLIVMKSEAGEAFFGLVNGAFVKLLQFSNKGAEALFGNLALMGNVPVGAGGPFGPVTSNGEVAHIGAYLAFSVLPTIIFFSSLMAMLYHTGIMERVVSAMAWAMRKTMRTSGSETLSASGNIFIGQTEAPLLIRPYLDKMTESELMAVMTGGFATVAGGVMAAYIGMLSQWFPDIAGHLLSASVMSAPAALVCAKIMIPEPDPTRSETYGQVKIKLERVDVNVIDAAARGAADGLKLALNVGGMLLAFIGLVYLFNYLFAIPSYLQHLSVLTTLQESIPSIHLAQAPQCLQSTTLPWEAAGSCVSEVSTWAKTVPALSLPTGELWPVFTMQSILGYLLQPIAWLMGVSWEQAQYVGQLFGVKTILNEFVAYGDLSGMLARGEVTGRSAVIATYALCGFANFGSIAIQIGGIGGIAPQRKGDLAKLGLRAMIGGTIAAMMTATVAGILY